MTTIPTSAPASASSPRKASRVSQTPVLGGVAGGLARHLAVPVLWVRAFFVLTAVMGGMGVVLYAGLWLVLPSDSRFAVGTPGGEANTRLGRRPGPIRRLADAGPAIALGALGLGAVLVLEAFVGGATVFFPLLIAVAGVALLWRQADEAQRERWLDSSGRIDPVRAIFGSGGWQSYARVGAGLGLVVLAFVLFALRGGSVGLARDLTLAAVLGVIGIVVVIGPWIYRLAADLTQERAERMRTQERADVAAHLHDSVLQTLALIQKNSTDAPTVARLARSQERDLRAWLYSDSAASDETLASAVRAIAAEVEDTYGIDVDVVLVGDGPAEPALLAACREALVNAAKHAGVSRVDVYAEVAAGVADVFVRDRGAGFRIEDVPEDRHGVAKSIIDRMARHGGSATVKSAPGEGTEVHLTMGVS